MHEGLVDVPSFLAALLLLIVGAKIGAEIAERLGQPSVLGEIVAGVLIGATGFGFIVRGFEGHTQFFRVFSLTGNASEATYQALDVLAEIGAIILLFEIGLHTDLYELRKVGKSALWVGFAGVVLPFVGGWYVSQHFLGTDFRTALIIGAALTATSVGITARVFQDLKMLHTPESQVVLGAAVADDVIGLVILAVISALFAGEAQAGSAGSASENLWIVGAKVTFIAVGFLVGAVVIGVKAVPLLERGFDHMRSRGAITVLALAFCLLIAMLGQQVKLAFIIGAFAAGLVLSHCNRQREMQDAIKPLADLFIPVFFAMMGTVVNLRAALGNTDVLKITLTLVAVAVVGKVLGCMTVPDKTLNKVIVGLAMIPRGEVGLIYARLGIQNGWLRASVYDGVVLMVILTTVMTPPLLRMASQRQKGRLFVDGVKGLDGPTHEPARNSHFSIERGDWEVFDMDDMMMRQSPEDANRRT